MLIHAGVCLHGNQHDCEVGIFRQGLRAAPAGLIPSPRMMKLSQFLGYIELDGWLRQLGEPRQTGAVFIGMAVFVPYTHPLTSKSTTLSTRSEERRVGKECRSR